MNNILDICLATILILLCITPIAYTIIMLVKDYKKFNKDNK